VCGERNYWLGGDRMIMMMDMNRSLALGLSRGGSGCAREQSCAGCRRKQAWNCSWVRELAEDNNG
jgi:hypothetical protein